MHTGCSWKNLDETDNLKGLVEDVRMIGIGGKQPQPDVME
jgi:hypothetical protein